MICIWIPRQVHVWSPDIKSPTKVGLQLGRPPTEERLLRWYFRHVPHRTSKPLPQCIQAWNTCFCWSCRWQGCQQLQASTNHDGCRERSSSSWMQTCWQSHFECLMFWHDRGVFERARYPCLCSRPRVLRSLPKPRRWSILQSSQKAGHCCPLASLWRAVNFWVDSKSLRENVPRLESNCLDCANRIGRVITQ